MLLEEQKTPRNMFRGLKGNYLAGGGNTLRSLTQPLIE